MANKMPNKTISSIPQRKHIAKYSGLKLRDYIGYALGDVGCCLVFSLNTSVLQNFYTDVLFLNPIFIMIMFVVARIWDAVNDPVMGRICDRMKPNKSGKFKRWFIYGGLPLMLISIMMLVKFPGLMDEAARQAYIGAYVFASITYILFGMMYTAVQIPYGSLASVVTADDKERSKLSVFRAAGAALGSLPVIALNSIAWTKDNAGKNVVNYTALIIGVIIMAVCSFTAMFFAYKFNKERITPKPVERSKGSIKRGLKRILKTRSMLILCIVGMLWLAQSMFASSFYPYLLRNYYNVSGFMAMIPTLILNVTQFVLMPFIPTLARKFGKKEVASVGVLICLASNLGMFFLVFNSPSSTLPWFYVLYTVGQLGLNCLNIQIWGMITDCIDDMQVKTGVREDGSSYAVFMFFRKFGQVIAAVTVNASLLAMNYDFAVESFTPEQLKIMFYLATLIPTAILVAIAILFILRYPITKKRLEALQDDKEAFYTKQEEEEKRLNALPKVYQVKMNTFKPKEKGYRGYEFEFMHKEKKYFYCVLIKTKDGHTEQAYRNQAKFKFNALVKSKDFDEYISKNIGLAK